MAGRGSSRIRAAKRYKEKDDELRHALDYLEHLNTKNAKYVQRIEAYQLGTSNDNKELRVKFR